MPSSDFKFEERGSVYKLKIAEVFPDDEGTYVCHASNGKRKVETAATLVVSGMA